MQRLADCLVYDLGGEPEKRPQPGGDRRAQVGHVVDLVGVKGDPPGQVDLDLVGRRDGPYKVVTAAAGVLRDRQQWRDVVARVGVLGSEERVMEIELAYGDPVSPGGPLGRDPGGEGAAEDRSAGVSGRGRVAEGLGAGGGHRVPAQRCRCHAGVVDQPVDDHVCDLSLDRHVVCCHRRELPGQLLLARQRVSALVGPHLVLDHRLAPGCSREGLRCSREGWSSASIPRHRTLSRSRAERRDLSVAAPGRPGRCPRAGLSLPARPTARSPRRRARSSARIATAQDAIEIES